MTTMIVLNPVAMPPPPTENLGARLGGLAGATVGFFSNNKPNADVVLARVAEILAKRFGIVAKHYNKGVPSIEAPVGMLDEAGEDCQAVVLAAFD